MAIGTPEILTFSGAALTVLNLIDKSISLGKAAKAPEEQQNQRLTALENDVREIKSHQNDDNTKIKSLENGTRVLLHSMSALLAHGIDGNNTEKLVEAKEELDSYLINK